MPQVCEAIKQPSRFPRFRQVLLNIQRCINSFTDFKLEHVPLDANKVSSLITKSVTRDRRYQSYIA